MQLTPALGLFAFAMVVAAGPAPNASPPYSATAPAPSKSATPSCSSSQTESCCGPQFSFLGIECVTLSLLSLLGSTCQSSSSIACCPNSGVQHGLVNIGTVCVPLSVVV